MFAVSIKEKQDFLRYIGYRNFINDLIKHVSLLILVHVRLLFCSCLTAVKNIGLGTMILFTKGTELTIFGQLKIPMMFSINLNLKTFPVLVLLFVALWFILRGDLLYVFPCVILFLCFSVLLVLRLPRLGKRELILVLFVRLFDLCLFGFVGFLFLLVYGKGCGL